MQKSNTWGRLKTPSQLTVPLNNLTDAYRLVGGSKKSGIPYGLGRSYGDVSLNPHGTVWATKKLDKFISFDETTGLLCCESGVTLQTIQRLLGPRGWILPVSPGTQMVTIGGAIANDVHGKNHYKFSSFGNHVNQITLMRTTGEVIECSPSTKPDWFSATIGGLGLTGVILSAQIQLAEFINPWMDTETVPFSNLEEFFSIHEASKSNWEHTVSWIDPTSNNNRGFYMRGNHSSVNRPARKRGRAISIGFSPPFSLVNKYSYRPLNISYYYKKKASSRKETSHYESFLYPLDNLLNWNKLYGPNGFYQYHCLVPPEDGLHSLKAILNAVRSSGVSTFLNVLKIFGMKSSIGMLGFPKPGITIAIDFPNQGQKTVKLFEHLDKIVQESNGRLYPAKDARMPATLFESGYPRLDEFSFYRDPGISSGFSQRIFGK
jgi:FAD/FMN-containing dehydrogenase